MTTALVLAGFIVLALAALWWLADHERGMRWTRQAVRRSFPDVPPIAPADLRAWLDDPGRDQPILLDVREPDEFAVSHLRGARRVDPSAPAGDALAGTDPVRPVVVYCAGGYRAAKLGRRLLRAGRREVLNLDGGIFA